MPALLFWDACALGKRYVPETGSATVDTLFDHVAASEMAITFLGYAETYSILLRTRNRGVITANAFAAAKSLLRREVIEQADFALLAIDETATLDGIDLMEQYNINASDAAILATYIAYAANPLIVGTVCAFVSVDHRFLRAAAQEGFLTLNPETFAVADVAAFLAAL